MSYIYINGQYQLRHHAVIPAEDRANLFADGIYEVVYIKQGFILDEDGHRRRLERSLSELQVPLPMAWEAMRFIIKRLLKLNSLQKADVALYMQISRGVAKRDHAFPKHAIPSVMMMASRAKFPSKAAYENGVAAITVKENRWLRRDIKSVSLLPNCMAKQAAVEAGVMESIFVEEDGTITEGSATNIFIVDKNQSLITHQQDEHILGGITRDGVLEVARSSNVKVLEQNFDLKALQGAFEVFMTSTTKHILPVTTIDGKKVGDGKVGAVTKRLMEAYQAYLNEQVKRACN